MSSDPERVSRLYAFNRRTVVDHILYVRAESEAEAWKRARADLGEEACDADVKSTTYRRVRASDPRPAMSDLLAHHGRAGMDEEDCDGE